MQSSETAGFRNVALVVPRKARIFTLQEHAARCCRDSSLFFCHTVSKSYFLIVFLLTQGTLYREVYNPCLYFYTVEPIEAHALCDRQKGGRARTLLFSHGIKNIFFCYKASVGILPQQVQLLTINRRIWRRPFTLE